MNQYEKDIESFLVPSYYTKINNTFRKTFLSITYRTISDNSTHIQQKNIRRRNMSHLWLVKEKNHSDYGLKWQEVIATNQAPNVVLGPHSYHYPLRRACLLFKVQKISHIFKTSKTTSAYHSKIFLSPGYLIVHGPWTFSDLALRATDMTIPLSFIYLFKPQTTSPTMRTMLSRFWKASRRLFPKIRRPSKRTYLFILTSTRSLGYSTDLKYLDSSSTFAKFMAQH